MQQREQNQILIVDDKTNMLRLMAKVLQRDGHIVTAENGQKAIEAMSNQPFDVVLCDLRMPDMDGLEVLKKCREIQPNAEFILMTAYASVSTAIEALRLGAYDYIPKPFEPDFARSVVLRALGRATAQANQPNQPQKEVLPGVIGQSSPMVELGILVQKFAASDATVLILGETGTGKERIARALYQMSHRSSNRFVALNCSAIPPDLLESELFGFAKGSFTGATHNREGLFEAANKGTLFLDEIGEMRYSLQAKLTRTLEERAIRRVGEYNERKVDVRIIAATHRDLEKMVADETFRQDLWYRLNVAVLRVPPLRNRVEDIELLANHFLKDFCEGMGSGPKQGFTPAAMKVLNQFEWPGNVRQLRACVERATLISCTNRIDVCDLPPDISQTRGSTLLDIELIDLPWSEAMEQGRKSLAKSYLNQVLDRFDGRVSDAANHAGVERESFYRLMRKFGISN